MAAASTFSRAHPALPRKRIAMTEADMAECPLCRDVEPGRRETLSKTLVADAAASPVQVWVHELRCGDCKGCYTVEERRPPAVADSAAALATVPSAAEAVPSAAGEAVAVTASSLAVGEQRSTPATAAATCRAQEEEAATTPIPSDRRAADVGALESDPPPASATAGTRKQQEPGDDDDDSGVVVVTPSAPPPVPATAAAAATTTATRPAPPPGATIVCHDDFDSAEDRRASKPRAAVTLVYDVCDRPSAYECPYCATAVNNDDVETGPVRAVDGNWWWDHRWDPMCANLMECTGCSMRFVVRHTAPPCSCEVCHSMSSDNKICPNCGAVSNFAILESKNVMYGQIQIRVCFSCRKSWRQKLSSGG